MRNSPPTALIKLAVSTVLAVVALQAQQRTVDRPDFPPRLYPGPLGCPVTLSQIDRLAKANAVAQLRQYTVFTSNQTRFAYYLNQPPTQADTELCARMYPRHSAYCGFNSSAICPIARGATLPQCTAPSDFPFFVGGPSPEGGGLIYFAYTSLHCTFHIAFDDVSTIALIWRSRHGHRVETFDLTGNFLRGSANETPLLLDNSWGIHPNKIPSECSFPELSALRNICR